MIYTSDICDLNTLQTVRSVMKLCGAVENPKDAEIAFCDVGSVARYVGRMRCVVFSRDVKSFETEEFASLSAGGEICPLRVPFSIEHLIHIVFGTEQSGNVINNVMNNTSTKPETGDDTVRFDGRFVTVNGKTVELTEKESGLFACLYRNAGRIVERSEIMREVWKRERETNIVDVYASYLRRKLDLILPPGSLTAVRGIGYILKI